MAGLRPAGHFCLGLLIRGVRAPRRTYARAKTPRVCCRGVLPAY